MNLNMYLGEVQSQAQSMNAVCTATIQGMEQAIQSIDAFAIDTVLQGQTYSSAKAFFTETFRPLAQGIIYLCEELIRQNDAFPSQFESKVASTDVIEQEILEQIQEIDRMKTSMEAVSQAMPIPSMDAMANLFTVMRKKLQEKLDHLYEFNQTSSNNYSTAIQLAASIATGLAEVQSGKGFSPASGTFSTQGLNMEWTTSIQEIIAKREAERFSSQGVEELGQSDFMKNDKTILDQLDEGVRVGSGRAVRDGIEDFKALGDKETWEDMGYAASHPLNTLRTMYNVLSDSYIKNVKNGDFEDAVIWFSYALTGIGVGLIGDKGIGKITKVLKGARYAKVKDIKVPRIQQTVTNWVDNLSIENRLAFANTNGLNLRSSLNSTAFEAEEKLSTHQFANSGGNTNTNAIKPGDTSPLAPGGGLNAHETKGSQRRGHLIKKHIGKTDAELLQRLQNDSRITGSSTFTDRATAEKVANATLSDPNNQRIIRDWLNNPRSRATIALDYYNNDIIGRGVRRGSTTAHDMKNAKIVLKKDGNGNFILTGYPVD
ncbi:cytoplasmic protein [Bacillus pseudomycoides]|uniref:RNase A-like domain-containing protein n=2 Tax=Bacillus pseudomycoides TaxID=64104 RepID=UPI000BF1CC06|nr:RNase A-like domain-containing protein [Bacillus pseudomycoides]PEK38297.1 cytoplasmic protein [Bacillus pseudomycoides]PEK68712.1 cytoplasmic protein [Bacillus pseudomycoides]PEP39016.1 cytoplasmic protein [Bacillus pseudomycoides]PEP42725.1 cytoplasmic protein [Bacillus pseudomycoides]PEP56010.1 cytoplasmic protein [Bacillus pseudomycoides]